MKPAAALAVLVLAGCAARPPAFQPEPRPAGPKLAGMQYLYGSGEAAAISRQAWSALVGYVGAVMRGKDPRSVVLTTDATLADPRFETCANKRPAAVFDIDETVLLNQGFEYDDLTGAPRRPFDHRWARWEQTGVHAVSPSPGAKEALEAIRKLGVTVIFNSNRNASDAGPTEQALDGAGLGPALHGQTLYLKGDDNTGPHKDVRRWQIADKYCVIAMGGDQLGDFSDLFGDAPSIPITTRRALTGLPRIASLWGNGWFVLPNPVYGTGLQGGPDDIFPPDKQWHDPVPVKEPH